MVKVLPVPISTISGRVYNNASKVRKIHVKPSKSLRKSKNSKSDSEESWLVRCFKEFAKNTALHGYNHIVREDSTKWER